ncbi:hypothetical protein NUSPORA_00544 [Nucleospora cyclopteri]
MNTLINVHKVCSKNIRSYSVQEIVCNEDVEIRVDNIIKTNINIQCNKIDIYIYF